MGEIGMSPQQQQQKQNKKLIQEGFGLTTKYVLVVYDIEE
jgi:hypothetical protein